MKTLEWDRIACIKEIRDRIWMYLSPASRFEQSGLLAAGALLGWPKGEAARLGDLQFLLCQEVGNFLNDLPQLTRKLATASAREEETTAQQLRGPVEWGRTLALRSATGAPNLYATAPARRVYQTPENELLVHVLDGIVDAAHRTGWERRIARQEPAKLIHNRLSEATRWQQSRMLAEVQRVTPASRSVARISSGRNAQRYATVLDAYGKLISLVERMDARAVQEAIENAGLVTADEPRLFELLTTFLVVDALKQAGWQMQDFRLFEGHVCSTGQAADGREVTLWYQTTPRELGISSRYRQILTSHGFTGPKGLRPDVILKWTNLQGQLRWLLIECKLSQSGGASHAARQALVDLLAYRGDFATTLDSAGGPYGLGVAWGEGLVPNSTSEVVLCTPDGLIRAIEQIVA